MSRKLLSLVLLFTLAVIGYWVMATTPTQGAPSGRVFEIRHYTANEGKLDALNARFRDHTMRIFKKHGMKSIGYWVPQDPPKSSNTLIYILAYPSREAAKTAWDAFRADPEWQQVVKESEANGKLVEKVESVFVNATDYSPLK